MKRSTVYLLAAPALVAFSSRGQVVEYAPKEGLVVTKHYTQSDESHIEDMSLAVDGTPQDAGVSDLEQTTKSSMEIVVVDEYGPVADGRPTRLKRTFEKLSSDTEMEMSHPMMGDQSFSMTGESELEGEVVVFTWDGEAGEYTVKFAEDSGSDEALLEDLAEDTDLRGLLPSSEVDEGDTWEIAPSELVPVFAFGGSLKFDVEGEGEIGGMGMGGQNSSPSPSDIIDELEGTVTATYGGVRDEDGVKLAVINLAISVNTAKDMTEFMVEAMEKAGDELPMEMEVSGFDIEFEFEGEALLLWDVAGGHLRSFEMNGDSTMMIDSAMSMNMGGRSMDMETSITMAGTQTTLIEVQ